MSKIKVDIPFLISIIILVVGGFLIFSSASLGLLSKHGIKYANVAFSQTIYGLFLGSIACFIASQIHYSFYRKYAFYIFLSGVFVTLLVFIPGIGVEHGGAKRWLYLGFTSFQPSELLKISFIIYLSAWISNIKNKINTFSYGFFPLAIMFSVVGLILLAQPDTDTFAVMCAAGLSIFIIAGGKWKHTLLFIIIGVLSLAVIAMARPYVMARIQTFINPESNTQSSGYQIQQSLIAIGSGGLAGRGFGQSIQKFNFLPEPIGDSIFAVASEEFGFIGSTSIILLFVLFTLRGLKIAKNAPDTFSRLMVVGIVIMIISQAFINISSMVGIFPLSGIPLPFVSQGGTALFFALAEVGIILNISKFTKKR
ncbi:MAG: putative peptidoglycan glycosyltransferase FtsW [Candidatus Paceibacterota bacterium]